MGGAAVTNRSTEKGSKMPCKRARMLSVAIAIEDPDVSAEGRKAFAAHIFARPGCRREHRRIRRIVFLPLRWASSAEARPPGSLGVLHRGLDEGERLVEMA